MPSLLAARALIAALLVFAVSLPVVAQPPAAPSTAPGQAIEVTGATHVEFDEVSGIWQMRGDPVTVTRGLRVVRAPAVTYDSRQQIVRATGSATYADEAVTLTAAEVTAWLQEERTVAEGDVAALLREESGEVKLRSSRLEVWTKDRRAVATGSVTLVRGAATMTGERVEYDGRARQAVITGRPEMTGADGTVTADRIEAYLDREEVVASGSVRLTHEDIEGTAPKAVLQQRQGIAVLSGGANVRQGRNEVIAQVVTVDLRRKRIMASGQAHIVVYP